MGFKKTVFALLASGLLFLSLTHHLLKAQSLTLFNPSESVALNPDVRLTLSGSPSLNRNLDRYELEVDHNMISIKSRPRDQPYRLLAERERRSQNVARVTEVFGDSVESDDRHLITTTYHLLQATSSTHCRSEQGSRQLLRVRLGEKTDLTCTTVTPKLCQAAQQSFARVDLSSPSQDLEGQIQAFAAQIETDRVLRQAVRGNITHLISVNKGSFWGATTDLTPKSKDNLQGAEHLFWWDHVVRLCRHIGHPLNALPEAERSSTPRPSKPGSGSSKTVQ